MITGLKVWQKRRKMAQVIPMNQNQEENNGQHCLLAFGCCTLCTQNGPNSNDDDRSLVDFKSITICLFPLCALLVTPFVLSLTAWAATGRVSIHMILRGSLFIAVLLIQPLCIYVRKAHVRTVLRKKLGPCSLAFITSCKRQ